MVDCCHRRRCWMGLVDLAGSFWSDGIPASTMVAIGVDRSGVPSFLRGVCSCEGDGPGHFTHRKADGFDDAERGCRRGPRTADRPLVERISDRVLLFRLLDVWRYCSDVRRATEHRLQLGPRIDSGVVGSGDIFAGVESGPARWCDDAADDRCRFDCDRSVAGGLESERILGTAVFERDRIGGFLRVVRHQRRRSHGSRRRMAATRVLVVVGIIAGHQSFRP